MHPTRHRPHSTSQEICTRFLLCYVFLWLAPIVLPHIFLDHFAGIGAINCANGTVSVKQPWIIWINKAQKHTNNCHHNHNKTQKNKTTSIFHGISRSCVWRDVIMGTIASQITSLAIVYSTVYSDVDQRKHQSSASRWPVNSPHKWPVMQKMLPFDDVIMRWMLWVLWGMYYAARYFIFTRINSDVMLYDMRYK